MPIPDGDYQLWYPVCMTCKTITHFPGLKTLPPSELKCQNCGEVCEDANVLIAAGELMMDPLSDAQKRAFIEATDNAFRNPDGSWM